MLYVILGIIVAIGIAVYFVKFKKKPDTPSPSVKLPAYDDFLQRVETVIRNPLSKTKLKSYFKTIEDDVETFSLDQNFVRDFKGLLDKYGISYPY